MLESLLEIEIAYSLLKSEDESAEGVSPIDTHYKQLKTDMSVLDRESDEFKMLAKYVQNTHAATHQQYDLEIQQVLIDNSFSHITKIHFKQIRLYIRKFNDRTNQ